MPVGFLLIYVVSLMGKEPSKEMQAFVDEIRKPAWPHGSAGERLTVFNKALTTRAGPSGPALFFGTGANLYR